MYYCADRNLLKLADAEFAAGVRPGHLHHLVARDMIVLNSVDTINVGTGRTAWVSRHTTTALAIIGALRGMGVPPLAASRGAQAFMEHADRMAKEPGGDWVYPEGRTLLVLSFGIEAGEMVLAGAGVMNHRPNAAAEFCTGPLQVILDAGEVVKAVDARIEVIVYREGPEVKQVPPHLATA